MHKKKLLSLNYHLTKGVFKGQDDVDKFPFFYNVLLELKGYFDIAVIDFIERDDFFVDKGIHYYFFKKTSTSKINLHIASHIRIKKIEPDVIYMHSFTYSYMVLFLKFFLKRETKIILQHHADKIPNSWWKRKILKVSDNYIDKYIFTSKELARAWVDKQIISSLDKVYEQPEISTSFRYDPNVKKDKNLFLWVARLNKNKNPFTIVNAFAKYIEANPKAKLVMFYSDNDLENDIRQFLQQYHLSNKIQLRGYIQHEKLEYWFQKSSYFILGSSYEAGSLALIEAMACGCIPILSNIPANSAIINKGAFGLLFRVGDENELYNCLVETKHLKTLELRKKIVMHFQNNLSFKSLSDGIYKVVEDVFNP